MRTILTTCLALLCTTAAWAGDEAKGHKDHGDKAARHAKYLAKWDANHDGKLDESEKTAARAAASAKVKEKHPEVFAKFDVDNSGDLSKAEFKALRAERKAHCAAKKSKSG